MAPIVLKFNNFRYRQKIASFDYDWTLVRPKTGFTFPKTVDDWVWLRPDVPKILKKYYKSGFCLIIFTNQSKKMKVEQISQVMTTLDLPIMVVIAMDKNDYKPNPLMFDLITKGRKVSKLSFFVGDALGRKGDWSNSDKIFAENIGLKMYSPEEIFPLTEKIVKKIPVSDEQELVVMIGYPASGKSTLVKKTFANQYVILNSDVIKSKSKMLKMADLALKEGKSVVIDAANMTVKNRGKYILIAKKRGIPVRCIWVTTSMQESMLRDKMRPGKAIPKVAYYSMRKHFEKPTEMEGCIKIVTI